MPNPNRVCINCHSHFYIRAYRRKTAKYCSKSCRYAATLAERFWSKVAITNNDSCWEWMAFKSALGYGRFHVSRPDGIRSASHMVFAHRISYMLTHADFDDSLMVLHKCDNPPCCRPDHLFQGIQLDNMQDMTEKGRSRHAMGSQHGLSKLTEAVVVEIRTLNQSGLHTSDIASRFNISVDTVRRVAQRKSWKHVP